ncbi:MAG: chemotaxis protein CheW [Eubacteriales bacterium]
MGVVQQVVFKLDHEEYGLDIMNVYVIEKYQEVVKVPNTPEYIEGIINLRGEVLPIYSLRKKFNLKDIDNNEDTKVIVTYTNDMKIGFVVDSVSEIITIDEDDIQGAPRLVTGVHRKYIKSVAKLKDRMVILIDIDKIITDEEQRELGQVIEDGLDESNSKNDKYDRNESEIEKPDKDERIKEPLNKNKKDSHEKETSNKDDKNVNKEKVNNKNNKRDTKINNQDELHKKSSKQLSPKNNNKSDNIKSKKANNNTNKNKSTKSEEKTKDEKKGNKTSSSKQITKEEKQVKNKSTEDNKSDVNKKTNNKNNNSNNKTNNKQK